jgi:hypothetical protein
LDINYFCFQELPENKDNIPAGLSDSALQAKPAIPEFVRKQTD